MIQPEQIEVGKRVLMIDPRYCVCYHRAGKIIRFYQGAIAIICFVEWDDGLASSWPDFALGEHP